MKKRLLSLLLALALLLTVLPQLSLPTRAEDEPDPLIGADEVVLEEITYFGTRIETMRMLYRLAGEPEVEDMSCLDQFTDLDPEIYSEEALRAVAWAVSNQISSGVSAQRFGPEQRTTKAQVITFVWKSFGSPAYEETACPYSDVRPGTWYYNAVMWSLGQTDWLDTEPEGAQFGVGSQVYYYKLFLCEKTDGSRCWKLRIGSQDLYSCGDDLRWSFDSASGILRITGSGSMWDYSLPNHPAPWYRYKNDIYSISLPKAEYTVGSSAFADFTNLTRITLPMGTVSLGHDVFVGCTALSSVTVLNPRLTSEGENPFGNPKVVVLSGYDHSTAEAYADQFGYEFESLGTLVYTGSCGKEGDNLLWSLEPATGILEITGSGEMQDYSFSTYSDIGTSPWYQYRNGITMLSLPDNLYTIGENAFSYCTSLTSVTLPEGLNSIGNYAFRNCTGLSAVEIPEGVTSIGDYTFSGCTGLSAVKIPEGVTSIGDNTFSGCTGLSAVEIPEGVTSIGHYTFSGCTGLSAVKLPEGLTSIDTGAFHNCTGLSSVTLPSTLEFLYLGQWWDSAVGPFEGCDNLTALVFRNANTYVQTGGECDTGEDLRLEEYDNAKNALGVPGKTVLYSAKTTVPASYLDYEAPGIYKNLPTYAADYGYTLYHLDAFSDVKEGSYYEIPVAWAVGMGITSGTGNGGFSPKKTCTREQVVSFLWKAAGSPEPEATSSPFPDVKPSKYYFKPVLWALERGITSGQSDGRFGVGKACTREQVVSFLWKAVGSPEPEGTESPFTDVKPGKYYFKPVLWAVENGVTSGASATTFGVGKSCTRAQIVTFLYNVYGK